MMIKRVGSGGVWKNLIACTSLHLKKSRETEEKNKVKGKFCIPKHVSLQQISTTEKVVLGDFFFKE